MELLVIFVIFAVILKNAAKNEERSGGGSSSASTDWSGMVKTGKDLARKAEKSVTSALSSNEPGDKGLSAAELRKSFASVGKKKERPSPTEIRDRHASRLGAEWEANEEKNRREREESAKRFSTARARQDDAERLHTVHVDSCEGRLESLKVLYEAGILDREEYRVRVERVKRRHREAQ